MPVRPGRHCVAIGGVVRSRRSRSSAVPLLRPVRPDSRCDLRCLRRTTAPSIALSPSNREVPALRRHSDHRWSYWPRATRNAAFRYEHCPSCHGANPGSGGVRWSLVPSSAEVAGRSGLCLSICVARSQAHVAGSARYLWKRIIPAGFRIRDPAIHTGEAALRHSGGWPTS